MPPYSDDEATTWSPDSASVRIASVDAAWPDATASAPGRPIAVVHPPSRAFESGLERTLGRVHDARVDVADLGQTEEVRCVLGVAEFERRRLVDGHRSRAGGRIGFAADVDLLGLEAPVVAHGPRP